LFERFCPNARISRRAAVRDETRSLWYTYDSEWRYELLVERIRERRGMIRTANRKFRRQCGLGLKGA
jgi:hypothetical protein